MITVGTLAGAIVGTIVGTIVVTVVVMIVLNRTYFSPGAKLRRRVLKACEGGAKVWQSDQLTVSFYHSQVVDADHKARATDDITMQVTQHGSSDPVKFIPFNVTNTNEGVKLDFGERFVLVDQDNLLIVKADGQSMLLTLVDAPITEVSKPMVYDDPSATTSVVAASSSTVDPVTSLSTTDSVAAAAGVSPAAATI